jgi:ribosomal protein S18 acetylase RimI-like enzyme
MDDLTNPPAPLRWATTDDIGELSRLRRVMFESMGQTVTPDDDAAAAAVLAAGLPTGGFFAAVVDGEGFLAACGVGMVAQRLPSPGNTAGHFGYIQSMVTDERARRRGHGRRVLQALLGRFTELGVTRVDLHATDVGASLYVPEGFAPGPQPELRWRSPEDPHRTPGSETELAP